MKKMKTLLFIFLLLIFLLLALGTNVQAENIGLYTLDEGCIARILPETTIANLKINLLPEENCVVKNSEGEIVGDNDIVKTGMTLESDGTQYKVSVVGDINGDGKVTITDLVQCNLHTTNIKVLKGENVKSADINGDGNCTVTDLVQLNLVVANIKDITEYVKYIYSMPKEELNGMLKKEYKPDEDEDKDGLTNAEEEALGTNVYNADTDADGLTDYYEVNISKTDPLKSDTDGDGINDGDEVALGLNPLAVDSKGDGINDSQRTLTYKVEDEDLGVCIDITGKGNIANTTVDTLDKPESEQRNDVLDTIYNFHTNGEMENAVITIKYSVEELEQKGLIEDNISLYYINTNNNKIEKVNSTVDKESKTITATLDHFSMYIIGKKDLNNFSFNAKCDGWVDTDNDGIADEIVIVNSGFDPKVNGFSFKNFGSNKSDEGNCYGMATFAMAYYIDKLPSVGKADKFWTSKKFGTWETKGYDLTGTYFENGGNLYDFKIETEPLKYKLLYKLSDLLDYDGIENGYLKLKEEYYNKLNEIGTIYKDVKIKGNGFNKYQYPLLNVESDELKNNITNDENQMLNAIWNLYMLQAHDDSTSFSSNPDLALKELQANLQNGIPVVLSVTNDSGHAINAISLIQDVENPNEYKIAVYDNNYPGETRYIDVTRYKYNKFTLDFTAWTNEYGYKCKYGDEEVNLTVNYPKLEEKHSIYAKLYDDGTLAITATSKDIKGKTVVKDYGDISRLESAPWNTEKTQITTIDIVDKITPNEVKGWFNNCNNLTTINNMENLDTNKVTSMNSLFSGCSSLTNLDLSSFNTNNVTDMGSMFSRCKSLTSLDLSSFNTSNVTNMQSMFDDCQALTSLNVSNFNTSNVIYMNSMFNGCFRLTSLDVSNFNTSNVIYMNDMFAFCYDITNLDLSNFNTTNVTNMGWMFGHCEKLTSLNISNFDTSEVTNMRQMFGYCESLTVLNLKGFNTSKVTNMSGMFYGCTKLISVGLGDFDTANVTDMNSMFFLCKSLASLDVSNFSTEKVTNMSRMFHGCQNLTDLNLSSFDTSNVVNISEMFHGCENLTVIDLSNFNTSNVMNMSSMFEDCKNLTNINLVGFNTSNVQDMSKMFKNCNNLISLNLNSFNTENVKNMSEMFRACSSITNLDLSTFNISNVQKMRSMFCDCGNLTEIYVGLNWDTSNIDTIGMFLMCGTNQVTLPEATTRTSLSKSINRYSMFASTVI